MPFPDLAKELGIFHSWSRKERVMHQHYNIFRCEHYEKPSLNVDQHAELVPLANEGLQIPQEATTFTDEMWVV